MENDIMFNDEQVKEWALAYLQGENESPDRPSVHRLSQFIDASALDIIFERSIAPILVVSYAPYGSYSNSPIPAMRADVNKGRLLVARSVESEMWTFSSKVNNRLRFIHDVWHHVDMRLGFDIDGEYAAWVEMCHTWRLWALARGFSNKLIMEGYDVLFSEMVLQAAAGIWLGGYDAERGGLRYSQKLVLGHRPNHWLLD
jgi:hypothetical protein